MYDLIIQMNYNCIMLWETPRHNVPFRTGVMFNGGAFQSYGSPLGRHLDYRYEYGLSVQAHQFWRQMTGVCFNSPTY